MRFNSILELPMMLRTDNDLNFLINMCKKYKIKIDTNQLILECEAELRERKINKIFES